MSLGRMFGQDAARDTSAVPRSIAAYSGSFEVMAPVPEMPDAMLVACAAQIAQNVRAQRAFRHLAGRGLRIPKAEPVM